MPTTQMCAACVHRSCDCTAVVFKQCPQRPGYAQSLAVPIPGIYCEPAAWRQVLHALRSRGAEYIGGEVRKLQASARRGTIGGLAPQALHKTEQSR